MLDITKVRYRLVAATQEELPLELTQYCKRLVWGHRPNELATYLEADIAIPINGGGVGRYRWLGDIIDIYSQVQLFVETEAEIKQVFGGRVYRRKYREDPLATLSIVAYDPLRALHQNRDDYLHDPGDAMTMIVEICNAHGLPVIIDATLGEIGEQIHRRRTLAEMLAAILRDVQKHSGFQYNLRWDYEAGALYLAKAGLNQPVWWFRADENVLSFSEEVSIEDMITQIQIIDDSDNVTLEVIKGPLLDSGYPYGPFQDVLHLNDIGDMGEASIIARNLLEERGFPSRNTDITVLDVPFVQRGDNIRLNAGTINHRILVNGIEHDALSRTMNLDLALFVSDAAVDETSEKPSAELEGAGPPVVDGGVPGVSEVP